MRFTVVHLQPGRRAKGSRCVKATRRNRRARRCTVPVTIRGSFTLPARAGANSFRFTGRLGARKLTPGSYRLIATPLISAKPGRPASASFRIIR